MPRLRRSEVSRREHRRRLLFAVGPSTSPAFPDAPTVTLVLNNGTQLDISSDVRFSDGITVRRGRTATDTRVRAGSAVMKINNRDGKYSPRNPTSVLYGLIGRGTQIFVTRHGTYRFWGEIPEWPTEWTTGGQDAWVNLTAAGPFRRLLAPNAPTLQSALTRSAIAAGPVALWTLEEGSGATKAIAYDTSQPSLFPDGTVSFGSVSDIQGGEPAVDLSSAGASLRGSVPSITGSWGFEFAAKAIGSDGNALIRVADVNRNLYQLFPPGGTGDPPFLPMVIGVTGAALGQGNGTVTNTFGSAAAFNNVWYYYGVYFSQHGTKITTYLYVNGVFIGSLDTADDMTLGSPAFVELSQNDNGQTDGSLIGASHLSFFKGTGQSAIAAALDGYTGEVAGRRMQRLLNENGIAFVGTGNLDDTMPMGPQGSDRLVDLIYDCEDVDMGFLGEDRNSFAITYRTLVSMLNQFGDISLGLDYPSPGNLAGPMKPSDNDQRIVNDSDVALASGAGHFRYALTSGAMSTASPAAGGIGTYPENPTVNAAALSNAADVAGWHVNVGTVDAQRFDQIDVNLANTATNHGLLALAGQMVSVNIGDRITIDSPPVWTTVEEIALIMVGQSERFDQFRYEISYDTVLADPYEVGLLDDPVFGILESNGTSLQSAITSTATTFQGLTVGGERWTTVATDFPFDIMVGGERMTVTSIAGVLNPQTWTVVRSVNGVVKAQNAGTAVIVRHPFRLAV